ncbi:MAG: hypothetical protein ABJA71_03870 [Ginsengibacter sp.]
MRQQLTHEEHSILAEIIRKFLMSQKGYNPHERINIFYENDRLCIVYGKHLESSITANGDSPDLLFENFMTQWKVSENQE